MDKRTKRPGRSARDVHAIICEQATMQYCIETASHVTECKESGLIGAAACAELPAEGAGYAATMEQRIAADISKPEDLIPPWESEVQPMATANQNAPLDPPAPADRYTVWTAGACHPNPGIGGFGYLLHSPDAQVIEGYGGEAVTTNYRIELAAAIEALASVPAAANITVYTYSHYLVYGANCGRETWTKRRWRLKSGEPRLNMDLWKKLDEQQLRVRAEFVWVRGHNGNPGNERADTLAAMGRQRFLESLTGCNG